MRLNYFFICFFLTFSVAESQSDSIFSYYQKLNDSETRLAEFKDSDNNLKLKLKQLELINANRKKHNAEKVGLDILASRVANKMCKEAAENNYMGHWNLAGEKPYHRYAFAGGKDHVAENASGKWTSGKFEQTDEVISGGMQEMHGLFMAEKSPNDGHKKNCIDKLHNFVGIGFYLMDDQFRYYEEFIDRYFTFEDVPETVKPNETFSITVSPQQGQFLFLVVAFYEDFTKPMKPKSIDKKDHYDDFSNKEALKIEPWELAKMRTDNKYSVEMKFKKPGLYYLHIYQDKKETKKEKSYTTKGKIEGCGIVIRVEK